MLKINFSPLINLILDKHFQILNNFENNIKKIDNEVSKISSKFTKNDLILSNLLERPLSLYFFLKLRKRVKFAFFEHGETSGYQKCWDIRKKSQTTILGDFAFFSHQHGLNTHKNILSKKIIASSIGADRRYFLKKNLIKKMILRLIVGVPLFKKNVVYLADLFRNNSTITPHIGRDLDVFEDTYKIINYLKEHHKKKTIILKQYPTSLYKDDFLINLDGVKTLSIFNWMHIYYIFDEIYFSAIQSSWLYKNQWQKIFLINRSHYPIHMKFIKSKKKINANLNNKLQLYKVEKISNKIDKGCWINLINQ